MKLLRIFVYGSLKAGAERDIFKDLNRTVLPARLSGASLYDLGAFPGLKLGGCSVVYGELHQYYEQEQYRYILDLMDQIEGYRGEKTDLYKRVEVEVSLESGEKVKAYTYVFNWKVEEANLIHSGVWENKPES
jgi:gamma-glutamylcyclotransferase (GGCT)/AIG2-like uncharacterized protein YtfP